MSSISPSEFFKWDRPRLLVDIRPIGAFLKGSIQGAISLPIVGQDPVEDFRRYAKNSSISRPLHLIDQHGSIASQLCHDKHSKFLQGGYNNFKAWRNKQFEDGPPVSVLGGYTGSGKTKILLALKNLGHQVIDLEQLASHKGSVFGGALTPQPLHEQFQNRLLSLWQSLDPTLPVWLEEKGPFLGRVGIPDALYRHMRKAVLIHLEVPFEKRICTIKNTYPISDRKKFRAAVRSLEARMGPSSNHKALHYHDIGKDDRCLELLLKYYDQAYAMRRSTQWHNSVIHITHHPEDLAATVEEIVQMPEKEKPAAIAAGNSIPKN